MIVRCAWGDRLVEVWEGENMHRLRHQTQGGPAATKGRAMGAYGYTVLVASKREASSRVKRSVVHRGFIPVNSRMRLSR